MINFYGLAFIVAIMIPNIIFAVTHRDGFENNYKNKIVETLEQVGRFGCFIFEILQVPALCVPRIFIACGKDRLLRPRRGACLFILPVLGNIQERKLNAKGGSSFRFAVSAVCRKRNIDKKFPADCYGGGILRLSYKNKR
mgnify:CR=1 FL=1